MTYIEVYDIMSNIIYYDMSSIVHTQPGAHAYAVQKSRDSILLAYWIEKEIQVDVVDTH